jgi:GNAT superfamily N-acetyltransferase
MMTDYIVRFAVLADLPALRAMWVAMMQEIPQVYPANMLAAETVESFTVRLASVLVDPATETFCLLASAPNGQPVGFHLCGYDTRALGTPERFIWIYWIYSVPAYRNTPLAEDLARLAAEHALARGVTMAEMSRMPGHAHRRGLGFEPFEVRCAAPLTTVLERLDRRRVRRAARATPQPIAEEVGQCL